MTTLPTSEGEGGPARLLSVVVPNYNHARLLPRAVASVLDQAPALELLGIAVEVVLVDDASVDDSAEVIAGLAARHGGVRVLCHPANAGAPAALNTGLAAARGDFVSFLGADDVALPGLYAGTIAALDAHPGVPLACGEIVTFDETGRIVGLRPAVAPARAARHFTPAEIRRRIRASDNWICNTVTVYRTEAVRRVGGFDVCLGAFCDGYLVRRLAFEQGFCFVPGIVGGWQVRAGSLSASSMLTREENHRLTQLLERRLSEEPLASLVPGYAALYRRRWQFATARLHFVWQGAAAEPEAVAEAAGGTALDRHALSLIRNSLGYRRLGRMAALAWLTLRLRPTSLTALVASAVRNTLLRRAERARAASWIAELTARAARLTHRH